ncbi:MAG: hypothetical protein IJ852_05325 [Alphaproteobacteria bacterium]|nr:hypothetical protein [Alphaproteobacteria bacterium]
MKKNICEAKLNALIANAKAFKALCEAEESNPDKFSGMTVETGIHLCRLTAREPLFKHKSGNPFYAFVKHVGTVVTVVVDVQSGSVLVVDNDLIASQTEVKGKFTLKGVTYQLKDTMNGFKRYKVSSCARKQRRKRLDVQEAEALASAEARAQYLEDENESGWLEDEEVCFKNQDDRFDLFDVN